MRIFSNNYFRNHRHTNRFRKSCWTLCLVLWDCYCNHKVKCHQIYI